MCGIAGIIWFNDRPVDQSDLKRMTDAMQHRGPDGEGFFADGPVGLGHRRLAIIDLSATGAQPMRYFGLTITYNGELYNYLELRAELSLMGYHFATASDTEVMLAAYHAWGTRCLQRFNGMWAFAIYDEQRQELFLARDRFGEKPLYYTSNGQGLLFASELKALFSVGVQAVANQARVLSFLVHEELSSETDTFFEDIFQLPAGHHLTVDVRAGTFSVGSYFDPAHQPSPPAAADEFSALLQHSVDLRMRADVPVGLCLSGGIDSSLLAVQVQQYSAAAGIPGATAITATLPGHTHNEAEWARQVVDSLGLNGRLVDATKADWWQLLHEVVRIQEEPFDTPSVCMQQLVMRAAAANGLRVLLDGQGADELWLGYQRYLPLWLHHGGRGLHRLAALPRLLRHTNTSSYQLATMYFYHSQYMRRWHWRAHRWQPWLQPVVQHMALPTLAQAQAYASNHSLNAYRALELRRSSLPALLRYEDKNAMACSIETRLPYLDPGLVSVAMQMPIEQLWQHEWTKFPLRQALANAGFGPLAWRRQKIGFEPPAEAWLYQTAEQQRCLADNELVAALVKPGAIKKMPRGAAWRLLVVACWSRAFGVVWR